MIKKYGVLFILVWISTSSSSARTWTYYTTPSSQGPYPSLVLVNGTQPVVMGSYPGGASQLTPLGWVSRPDLSGGIAGDGGTTIVSNGGLVKHGKDGRFYSVIQIDSYLGGCLGTTLENGVFIPNGNTALSGGGKPSSIGICSADSTGRIYLAYGNRLNGGIIGDGTGSTLDLAISDFGDVAVSTLKQDRYAVSWFDHAKGIWSNRDLGSLPSSGNWGKVAVEFDRKGNLGVAYLDNFNLHFAYYDFAQDLWQDDFLKTISLPPYGIGAALAFNKNDLPVIAAGNVLAYDPLPEPVSILLLGLGLTAVWGRRITNKIETNRYREEI